MESNKNNDRQEEAGANREDLEKVFKKLEPDIDPPKDLKKEVFNTLDTITFFGDIVDLFTVKFSTSEANFLDLIGSDEAADKDSLKDEEHEEE